MNIQKNTDRVEQLVLKFAKQWMEIEMQKKALMQNFNEQKQDILKEMEKQGIKKECFKKAIKMFNDLKDDNPESKQCTKTYTEIIENEFE